MRRFFLGEKREDVDDDYVDKQNVPLPPNAPNAADSRELKIMEDLLMPPEVKELAQGRFTEVASELVEFNTEKDIADSHKFLMLKQEEFPELQQFIQYLCDQYGNFDFVVIGKGDNGAPISVKDISTSPSPLPHGTRRELEDSWVLVPNNDLLASKFVHSHLELQTRAKFTADWPSFGVYEKISWVLNITGQLFIYGYVLGSARVIDSIYNMLKNNPVASGGLGFAATFAAYNAPQLILKSLSFVVIGGVVGGAATAAPILIIGSSGVFVSAAVYHLYQVAKRGAQVVAMTPHKSKLVATDGSTWYQ